MTQQMNVNTRRFINFFFFAIVKLRIQIFKHFITEFTLVS